MKEVLLVFDIPLTYLPVEILVVLLGLSLVLSFLMIVISFLSFLHNFRHSKRLVLTDIITRQRIEWLGNLRSSISEFINACLFEDDIDIATQKRYQVELYLTPENFGTPDNPTTQSKAQRELIDAMKECISDKKNNNDMQTSLEKVITKTQIALNLTWQIAKSESTFVHTKQSIEQRKILGLSGRQDSEKSLSTSD